MAEDRPNLAVRSAREVGLIVLGVLIALGLESAWQGRGERVREQQVLASLSDELNESDARLESSLSTHRRIDDATEAVLTIVTSSSGQRFVEVPDSLLAQIIRGPTYLPLRASLDAALSTGQIELIRSNEIQRSLAAWSQLAEEALEEERDGRDFVSDHLLPLLYASSDLSTALGTYVNSTQRGETGVLEWGETTSLLETSPELENLLWRRRFYAATARTSLEALREHLRSTSRLLSGTLRAAP